MIYVVSRYSHAAPVEEHNCMRAEFVDYGLMSTNMSRDVYLDGRGVPYEIGHGHILNLEFENIPGETGLKFGVSSISYELLLILSQLKSFLLCRESLERFFINSVKTQDCYAPLDYSLSQLALNQTHYMPINDAYEILMRYMCGATHYGSDTVQRSFSKVFEHFHRTMSGRGLNSSESNELLCYSQSFRLHRIVSNLIFKPV